MSDGTRAVLVRLVMGGRNEGRLCWGCRCLCDTHVTRDNEQSLEPRCDACGSDSMVRKVWVL